MERAMPIRSFTHGQLVRDGNGDVHVVDYQTGLNGCVVWVMNRSDWFHPSKLFHVEMQSVADNPPKWLAESVGEALEWAGIV
jgi:hypothetical protein